MQNATLTTEAVGLYGDLNEFGGMTVEEIEASYGDAYESLLEELVTGGYAANGDGTYRLTGKALPAVSSAKPKKISKGRASYIAAGAHMRESTRIANQAKLTGCAMRVWSAVAVSISSYSKTQDRLAYSQIAAMAFPDLSETAGKAKVARYMPEVLASRAIIEVEPASGRRAALYRLPSPS